MRLSPLVLALLSSVAHADREIRVPMGRKLLEGQVRIEALFQPGEERAQAWLGAGFLQSYDGEINFVRNEGGQWEPTLDLAYNFTPPITDIAPGISVGLLDLANKTEGGRAGYLAMTYRYGNVGDLNQDVPTDLTIGFWSRKSGLLFFAVSLPISDKLLFLAEHDSLRLAGGIELRPVPFATFKAVFERGGTLFSAGLTTRF
ncbi:MAG: hypothetical protein KIT11_07655 [Fimbriimonadaceae bacterium]|nr:hypothetical protein [Fimbriimonadaceae bacterium]QYK56228.1 MAG: hypothetical protein KF733_01845 [Fimbriimonadaceae bacterium]